MEKTSAAPSNRARILDSALTCFIENGLQRTGMREIARHAGVSLGNLYNHFKGKDDLIAEIARMDGERIEGLLESIDPTAPADRSILRLLLSVMEDAAQPAHAVLSIDLTAEAVRNPDVAAAFATNERKLQAAVADLVARVGKDDEKSALALAKTLLDMAGSIGMRTVMDPKYTAENGASSLRRLLQGLAPASAKTS